MNKNRSIKEIESRIIGTKKIVMKMKKDGGTISQQIQNNDVCCITDENLFKLGQVALQIHKFYRNPRDIEWGIKDNQIYALQSRPITNLDNSFTEYEIIHEKDNGHQSEFEIFTRMHVAESLPKSSCFCMDFYMGKGAEAIVYVIII